MNFTSESINNYCESFTEPESDLLKELNRQTHLRFASPRMLSGHLQGRFLSFISTLINPQFILEIGTFTGYSALCLAEGLKPDGKLITIDPNEETNRFAQEYFSRSEFSDRILLNEGDASAIIPALEHAFDLVFIDADKINYSLYYDLIIDKVRKNGLIIADNVLWSGKVLDEKKDADTKAIHEFSKKVSCDKRVVPMMLPVRDGLMLLRKL